MTSKDYASHTVFSFVPSHNLGNYLPTMGNDQGQTLKTEKFRQNQAIFRNFIAIEGVLKKKYHPYSVTSLPVATVGPDNIIWTSVRPYHATVLILELQDDKKNLPRGKFCQYDGSLQPRGTPGLIDRTIGKGEIIREIRGTDDF